MSSWSDGLLTKQFFLGLVLGMVGFVAGLIGLIYISTWMQSEAPGASSASGLQAPDLPTDREQLPAHGSVPWNWALQRIAASDVAASGKGDAGGRRDTTRLATYRGRTIVLNLWATWCGPCKIEMPTLQALHDTIGRDIAVVLVSDEKPATVRQYLADEDYTMPVYVDAGPRPERFRVPAIPTTFIIDPQGRIVFQHTGLANWNADDVHRFLDRVQTAAQASVRPVGGRPSARTVRSVASASRTTDSRTAGSGPGT
jgi:thiol-disulfide isomerase/thioredoxin